MIATDITVPQIRRDIRAKVYPFGPAWHWKCSQINCHGGRAREQATAMDAARAHLVDEHAIAPRPNGKPHDENCPLWLYGGTCLCDIPPRPDGLPHDYGCPTEWGEGECQCDGLTPEWDLGD